MTYANTKFSDFWHGSMLAALTACMAVGLADVAHSATPDAAPSVKVGYGDLNLASEQGANTLYARIAAAARRVCAPDGADIRDLQAYAAARSCERQAIANAVRDVHSTKVGTILAARLGHG
ncbi:MAG TPA: UrcA family protein [Steroidobacteraceae bacterium]|jgi:UrcA family protein|nr:UrcA family protein [Steroidobacteraceae bacterium]